VTAPEVPGVTGAHIGTLEVPHENLYKVGLVMDATGRKMLQPSSRWVGQEQREITNDEAVVVRAT
jgi:hypothetical protein